MKGYHEPGAPITIVLRAVRVLSLGVRRKVYSGHCLHIPRAGGFPVSAGIRNGTRISWRCGMAAGSGFLAAPVSVGPASTWPRDDRVGHYLANVRQLWPIADEEATFGLVFGCGSAANARSLPGRLDPCRSRSGSNQALELHKVPLAN